MQECAVAIWNYARVCSAVRSTHNKDSKVSEMSAAAAEGNVIHDLSNTAVSRPADSGKVPRHTTSCVRISLQETVNTNHHVYIHILIIQ